MTKLNNIIAKSHTDRKHAYLPVSASAQWLKCPGSIAAEIAYREAHPDAEVNRAHEEGTFAHEVADFCIDKGVYPNSQKVIKAFKEKCLANGWDWDVLVTNLTAYINKIAEGMKGIRYDKMLLETRVDVGEWIAGGFGTLDVGFIGQKEIYLFDLKYGFTEVDATDNTQLMIYALGLYNTLTEGHRIQIKAVNLNIIQPRIMNFSKFQVSISDLLKFGETVKVQSKKALGDNPERIAGDTQCRWCDAKTECDAYTSFVTKDMVDFDSPATGLSLAKMSDAKIRKIIENRKMITDFLDLVELHVKTRILDGGTFKGYKVVEGTKRKVFHKDKIDALKKQYGDVLLKAPSLKSMTEIQKIIKGEEFEAATYTPPGEPKLAQEGDKRPPYEQALINEFSDLTDTDKGD